MTRVYSFTFKCIQDIVASINPAIFQYVKKENCTRIYVHSHDERSYIAFKDVDYVAGLFDRHSIGGWGILSLTETPSTYGFDAHNEYLED